MKKMMVRIQKLAPFTEVMIRIIYYKYIRKHQKRRRGKRNATNLEQKVSSKKLFCFLDSYDINLGDTLIVHSSMAELSKFSVKPMQIFDYLLKRLGETGNLVFPTFPIISNYHMEKGKEVDFFNMKKKNCSTGFLPSLFLRKEGVFRSLFPYNSISAIGKDAEFLTSGIPANGLAHGKDSCWGKCYDLKAKILFLGVSSSKSTTMIHCAEDFMYSKWPVKKWYREQKYMVRSNDSVVEGTAQLRRNYWSRFMISNYRSKLLAQNNILVEEDFYNVTFGIIGDSSTLVDFVIQRARKSKLFFRVMRRHKKR